MVPKRRHDGFTLVELLIVISIVSVLLSVAAFALNNYIQTVRFNQALRTVISSVEAATNEAVTQSRGVTLSRSSNRKTLTWSSGNTQLGTVTLPHNVIIANQIPSGDIVISGRGLPSQQYRFVIRKGTVRQDLFLTPTGAVIW